MAFTYGQLKADIRQQLFPQGEARNLVPAHDRDFVDVMIELQTLVECLQQDNTSIIPQCATLYNCGLTVLEAPRGIIKKVEVIDKAHALPSGAVTASKSGSVISASEDFFDSSMVGSLIQFADHQTFTIVVYVNPTTVLVMETDSAGQKIYLGANARINASGNLELYNPGDKLWHEVTPAGGAGDVQIAINQTGVP